ncbi:MAG: hypothetical protein M1274_14840 [Actinobacteria bacterium]|nr:hypothetical protein [Actinomycetota bacterium]
MTKSATIPSPYAKSFGDYLHFIRTSVFRESLREYAQRVTLSSGYIGRLEQGLAGVPRRETVTLLATRSGQEPDVWLVKAGYAPEGDAADTELEYITLKLRRLTKEQLETVVDLIDAMAARNDRKGKR